MTAGNSEHDYKVGEFLVENGIVSQKQLQDALVMQKDNRDRLIGEILVTQGALTREEMIMAFEMYLMVTDAPVEHADEWLDQDEIDLIIQRMKDKDSNIK
jgi:type IV pilus assembly protein PilB